MNRCHFERGTRRNLLRQVCPPCTMEENYAEDLSSYLVRDDKGYVPFNP
jgi:hypothetical protein